MARVAESKTVLITGASSGIGAATAKALQASGYKVYASARRIDSLSELQDLGILTLSIDVTDDASMKRAVQKIGRIDVLINNAGYGSYGAFEEVSMDEVRQQMEVNVIGMARLTQLVVPGMRKAKSGTILNIGSMAGKFGEAYGSWYHVSKYAVEGLTDSLALELRPFGITAITIEPGVIRTHWWEVAAEHLEKSSGNGPYATQAKAKAASFRAIPNSRLASNPEKVANKIVKVLAKDNPRYRYAVGGGSRPILYLRRVLSDRMFYRLFSRF